MKKVILFLLIFIFITPAFASIPVKILKIIDGDTIEVKINSENKFSIRLIGIDCYETTKINRAYKQAYINKLDINEVVKQGNYATKYLKTLYKNAKEVSFEFKGIDKYGRVLGVVWFDEINVNNNLLKNNVCKIYEFKER